MRLSAVTVLDLTGLLPGPYATQLLADLGADVVKVEPPGGDPGRTMAASGGPDVFSVVNRGKRSVRLDLKTDGGRKALLDLAADADVVVEGFRPGVLDRLGVGYEAVREVNPEVVYCSLSGFGATGPNRDRAGHDLNYVGMAGLLDMTRAERGGRPAIPGFPVADMAGGLFAAFAIVAALLDRELGDGSGGGDGRGGDGRGGGEHLDVALTDVVAATSQAVAPEAFAGEDPQGRETPLTGEYPCYDVYETADGRYVTLAALEPSFWENFCGTAGLDELVDRQYADDPAEREAVREAVAERFRERTRDEWEALFGDEDAMVAPVYSLEEALTGEQVRERGLVRGGDDPRNDEGPRVGFPAIPSGGVADVEETVPDLGEHTEAVLREHGFDDDEIAGLRDDGTI